MLGDLGTVQRIAIYTLPVIFAITVHEAAHGYAAKFFGDMTAYKMGRISLNPARHIDPVGTVLVPALALLIGGMLFGWAKPVPVNFGRLRNPKKDMLWVAAAGPGVNLLMAILWVLLIRFSVILPDSFALPAALMGAAGVMINTVLMVLNLLPLPPLDGGRIVVSLLPNRMAWQFAKIEPYGFFILLALMLTHVLDIILWPLLKVVLGLISAIFL
ncbi:MAG: site-2 protease family protein [Methylophilales bacterium]|nr:site-2 protease family protein [Methylophilales bacterium]